MSKFFSLNLRDLGNGLLLAVIALVLGGAYTIISTDDSGYGTAAEWAQLFKSVVLLTISYLTKNLITNSDGKVGASEK